MTSLYKYAPGDTALPPRPDLDAIDFLVHDDVSSRAALAAAYELVPMPLSLDQVASLVSFLHALTDVASLDLRQTVPMQVLSGDPVAD